MPTDAIVSCRFPFPAQEPPVQMPEPCSVKCPNYDEARFALHDGISIDDPDLQAKIRNFARWFYAEGEPVEAIEEQVRYALRLYTRSDHTGTCVPKTILFAHYKHLQYSTYAPPLELSDSAKAALKGEPVASWPHGESATGHHWNGLFGMHNTLY